MIAPLAAAATKVFVAGHAGLVGTAIMRALQRRGVTNIATRTRADLDLCEQGPVRRFFADERPSHVILAAAKVGGIMANARHPAEFMRSNLLVQANVIDAAHDYGVKQLLFLGSSCIYPREAPQPLREEYLLTGPLEPTNEAFAVAKLAGVRMCQAYRREWGDHFISVLPTNLYGPCDRFDEERAHVIPALVRRFHEAKLAAAEAVDVWGSGRVRREFLHADDAAEACLCAMDRYDGEQPVNVGCGEDVTIAELAAMIADVVDFRGEIRFDPAFPDGTPRKLLDVSRITSLGWQPQIPLRRGLEETYRWYVDHIAGGPAPTAR